jgi:hypothetical protein
MSKGFALPPMQDEALSFKVLLKCKVLDLFVLEEISVTENNTVGQDELFKLLDAQDMKSTLDGAWSFVPYKTYSLVGPESKGIDEKASDENSRSSQPCMAVNSDSSLCHGEGQNLHHIQKVGQRCVPVVTPGIVVKID